MNAADKFLIFFGLLGLFYGYPLDFGPIIHPQFFFLYTENFDSVICFQMGVQYGPPTDSKHSITDLKKYFKAKMSHFQTSHFKMASFAETYN